MAPDRPATPPPLRPDWAQIGQTARSLGVPGNESNEVDLDSPATVKLGRGNFLETLGGDCVVRVEWTNEIGTRFMTQISMDMLVQLARSLARSDSGVVSITPFSSRG